MVSAVSVSPLIWPVDGARAAVFRQQRRMILDRAVLRNLHEFLRHELRHSHDADVCAGVLHRFRGFGSRSDLN